MTVIVILAAGRSLRMGWRDKLLEPLGNPPILQVVALRALATGARVIVVLPPDRPARAAVLAGLPVRCVTAEDAAAGMTASLRAGIGDARGANGAMILPADMPGLQTADLRRLLDEFAADPTRILRAASDTGQPGHPAIFPADLFADLMALTGDEGGRSVIARHRDRVTLVPLPGDRATLDLDTPDDWAAFRARLEPDATKRNHPVKAS